MAINDEFMSAASRKGDVEADYASSSDISAALKREMDGQSENHEAAAELFGGRISTVEGEVGTRDVAADLSGSGQMQMGAMCELAADTAEEPSEEAASSIADEFQPSGVASGGGASITADFRDDGKSSAGKKLAQNAALGLVDTILSDNENIAAQGWQDGRHVERVVRAKREKGKLKGGAATLAAEALDLADDDNVIREARDAERTAKSAYQTGKAVKTFIHDKRRARAAKKAANASKLSAKRKSMAIARGLREGKAVSDMSLATKIKTALRALVAQVSSTLSAIGAALAPIAMPIIFLLVLIVLIIMIVAAIFGGGHEATKPKVPKGLTEVEAQVYTFFSDKGLDDLHIAAIMGNMYAESGGYPSNLQHVPGSENPCSNEELLALGHASGKAAGLFQWDLGRRYQLGVYANNQGKLWYDTDLQLDYFWNRDIWQGNWGHGQYTKARFLETDDLETAVRIFCRGWEVAGTERMDVRMDAASNYLTKFKSGGGQSLAGATDAQNAIYNSCLTTPSPGPGYCAMWVSKVFANAGYPYPGGNACDMYWNWCKSSNLADLKVGMIVAVPSHSHDSAGSIYGHVAIYIGDGKVMENIGSVATTPLSSWMAYYGTTYPVKWGWVFGTDLSR